MPGGPGHFASICKGEEWELLPYTLEIWIFSFLFADDKSNGLNEV